MVQMPVMDPMSNTDLAQLGNAHSPMPLFPHACLDVVLVAFHRNSLESMESKKGTSQQMLRHAIGDLQDADVDGQMSPSASLSLQRR